jgi:hypothetical protein
MQNDNLITLILNHLASFKSDITTFKSEHEVHHYQLSPTQTLKLHSGWDEEPNPAIEQIYLDISGCDDDLLELFDTNKFKILDALQQVLDLAYTEYTDNDACSYTYEFDTHHASDKVTFSVAITDYLS